MSKNSGQQYSMATAVILDLEEELFLIPECDIATETKIIVSIAVINYSGMCFHRTSGPLPDKASELNMIFGCSTEQPEQKTESFSVF